MSLTPPVGPDDHVIGETDPEVTLMEFGDYQCPFCARAQEVVRQVRRAMMGRLRFVYRHFPLTQVHPQAFLAAQAAEAAGAQGQFWQMHERLFANQDALDAPDLVVHAARLGLDTERFSADLLGARYADRVRRNVQSGVRSGVNGTPTFFVDGLRYDGSWDLDSLLMVLTAAARETHPDGG